MPARFRTYTFNTSGIAGSTDRVSSAIAATDTAITLASGAKTVDGTQIQIDSERMLILAGGGTANLTVQRGYGGTTAAAHNSGAAVQVPGALNYSLLQVATIPNQKFLFAKTSADINYVVLAPYTGDTFPGGATSLILADTSPTLGTAQLAAPGSGTTWIMTAGAGASGATVSGGGGGTAGAPNIVSATAAVVYSLLGNSAVFGFAGTITLPANASGIGSITVMAFAPGATSGTQIAQLNGPFTNNGTVNYSGGQFPQPTAAQDWTLQFLCENSAGNPTASPVTITVAVQPSSVTAITGGDASALATTDPKYVARWVDETGSPHTAIWVQPTCVTYPQVVAVYYNAGDGNGWQFMANFTMTAAGQFFDMPGGVWVPTLGPETWQLAAIAGFENAAGAVSSLPSGVVESATFTVAPVGAINPNEFGLSFEQNGSGSLIDYAGPFNPGYYTWTFYDLAITFPASDVNLWDLDFTVQCGYVSGGVFTPISDLTGTERQWASLAAMMGWESAQPAMGTTVNINGPTAPVNGVQQPDWTFPSNTTNWVARMRVYAVSRLGTGPNGGTGTRTLLTGWPSGADHFDLTPGAPANALNASALVTGTVSSSLIPSVNASAITQVNASAITQVNASAITQVYAAAITSVNASAISSVPASAITAVNANSITAVNASAITSVNAVAINIGTISYTQIGSVAASTVTQGTFVYTQISSVSASSVSQGQLNYTQIASVSGSAINSPVSATFITSVNSSALNGPISAGIITSVNPGAINGPITASMIGSVNATTITIGLIGPGQISSVNASQINAGTITVGTNGMTINGSGGLTITNLGGIVISGGGSIDVTYGSVTAALGVNAAGATPYSVNGSLVINSSAQFVGTGGVSTSGTVNGSQISVGGTVMINSSGQWVGNAIIVASGQNIQTGATYCVIGGYYGQDRTGGISLALAGGGSCTLYFKSGILYNVVGA